MSKPNIEPSTQDYDSIQIMISRAKAICKVNAESLEIIQSRKGQKVIVDRKYVLVNNESPSKRRKVANESAVKASNENELTFVSQDIKKDIDTIIQTWRYKGEKLERENIAIGSSFIKRRLVNIQDLLRLHEDYEALITGYSKILTDHPESRAAVSIVLKNTEILQVAIGEVHKQVIDVRNEIEDNKEVDDYVRLIAESTEKLRDSGLEFSIDVKSVTEGTLTQNTKVPEFNDIGKIQCQHSFEMKGNSFFGSQIEPYAIDGIQHIAYSRRSANVQLWNVRDCSKVGTLRANQDFIFASLSFEKNGVPMLACFEYPNENISVWNLITKTKAFILSNSSNSFIASQIHINEDKMYLISGNIDGNVKVWDLDTREAIKTIKCDMGYIKAMQVISINDKDYLAVASDGGVGVWCLSQYTKRFELSASSCACLAYINHNNDALLAGDTRKGLVTIWNFKDDQPTQQDIKLGNDAIWNLEWIKSNGKLCLVSGHTDGFIRVWNMASNNVISTINNASSIRTLRVLKRNDRACILTFDENRRIKVWEEPVDES